MKRNQPGPLLNTFYPHQSFLQPQFVYHSSHSCAAAQHSAVLLPEMASLLRSPSTQLSRVLVAGELFWRLALPMLGTSLPQSIQRQLVCFHPYLSLTDAQVVNERYSAETFAERHLPQS